MYFRSIPRILSSQIPFPKPKFSTSRFVGTSVADKIYDHLKKNGSNVEKTLAPVKAKLDSKCVSDVLYKCHPGQSQMGLRFFIWAGLQPDYRHTSYMYGKACKLFEVSQNPKLISDIIEGYGAERCFVSVKSFKGVLNLYKEANLADEALWVLRKMPEFHLCADTTMYNSVIRLFCLRGDMNTAQSFQCFMQCRSQGRSCRVSPITCCL